uniref:28S ribosomal protein S16, mitochondrial-like isoform X1 n=1 Tax=Ciona intestinalis TaxID=7719 RepID=UPI00006A6053|nr:28S ribosomal protein S16, mitochondrial-like isoform X1 [Ciona intestinalis]|eukprot:XP_026691826.1 28S ribosomal protein S16, mitochondrial-like isoform X1 [Ciona intestinalis]
MVRLSVLNFVRKTGLQTPYRVSRFRYVAKGSEYLFQDQPDVKIEQKFDGEKILRSERTIRLALSGCTNRPFYRIVLSRKMDGRDTEVRAIEQLGSFDPFPNLWNEKFCALNFERIKHHLALGAYVGKPVRRLLGLSGYLPLDPTLHIFAEGLRRRREIEKLKEEKEKEEETD